MRPPGLPAEIGSLIGRPSFAELGARGVEHEGHGHGVPACAARNAALSAITVMLPPVRFRRARRSSRDPASAGGREHFCQIASALGDARGTGITTKRRRRRKAGSSALFMFVARIARPPICLHALQQVVDLDVGVAVVAVFDLAALAEQGVGLVEEQDGAAIFGGVEEPAQILLGFADVFADDGGEVDAVEVEAQFVGKTSAAMVLPVPLSPAKRALMPRPRLIFAANPQFRRPWRVGRPGRDLVQQAGFGAGQHKIVPGGPDVDTLREGVEARAGTCQAGRPKAIVHDGVRICTWGRGFRGGESRDLMDGGDAEVELSGEHGGRRTCILTQEGCPDFPLFGPWGGCDIDTQTGFRRGLQRFARIDQDEAVVRERRRRTGELGTAWGDVGVGGDVHVQSDRGGACFRAAKGGEVFEFRGLRRNQAACKSIAVQTQRGCRSGGH